MPERKPEGSQAGRNRGRGLSPDGAGRARRDGRRPAEDTDGFPATAQGRPEEGRTAAGEKRRGDGPGRDPNRETCRQGGRDRAVRRHGQAHAAVHLWPPCRCGLGQPGPAGPPRCRRSSESQVPPGSAWPGRGVSAQLSDSWPNHVNYLFGFFQSISCCVPQGGSGVKGAGRKGPPEAGARTRKKAKLRAQAEEASLSVAGQSLTGLAEEGLGTRGSGRVWKSKPARWSACPGAGPRGCGRLVSRQASSPGGCRPPPVSSVVPWPSFLTRSQRQQHAAAGASLSVTLDALFSADAFAD